MIVAGPGNDFVDGGPDDDILLGGGGTDFIVGGLSNDKLFNGAGTAIIYDGKGADHFGCSNSAPSLARSVVMDYNPTQGDKISGTCKHVS
jgi:Ca2+-binding RTX toxin-like protein